MKYGFMAAFAVASVVLFAEGAGAEEADVKLPEVVVTATKTEKDPKDVTQSVTVITQDDIKRSGARNVAEAVDRTSGTSVTDQGTTGSLQTLSIRGSEYAQVLVLLDGVRLNSPRDGGFDLSQLPLPLEDIERIEIVRGPGSALYGADAVGGVVNIITRKPSVSRSSIAGTVGSHGYDLLSAGQSGSVGNLRYHLSAGRETSDGYRENSDLDKTTVGGRIGYDVSPDSSLELTANYIGKEVGTPGSTDYLTPDARQWSHSTVGGLGFRSRLSQDLDVKVKTFYNNDILTFRWDLVTPTSRHESLSYGADGQFDWSVSASNTLSVGAEARADSLDSTDSGEHATRLWAGYAQDEIAFGESLILLLGARYDDHSVYGDTVNPRASARYLIKSSGTIIRASAGRSFRAPTFNDLYWPFSSFTDDGITYITQGNQSLQPETAVEYEGSIEQPILKKSSVRLATFNRRVKNMIDWSPSFPDMSTVVYSPENIIRAQIKGVEFGARGTIGESLALGIDYTYIDPIDETTGEKIYNIPKNQFTGNMSISATKRTVLFLEGKLVDNYERPGEDEWQYFVMNGKISQQVTLGKAAKGEIFFGMRNIFDRNYATVRTYLANSHVGDYPMPPREIFGGMSVQF